MEAVIEFIRSNPSLLLFAALAGGYALGKVKVKGFSLGSTTSVLLVGIVLGALIVGNKTHYDLVTVGIGIVLGTLLGLVAVPVAGIPLTLGVGGGVLVSGLFFGWMRSLKPTWGAIPSSALWIFTDLGLNLFIACVGVSAGPKALQALRQAGPEIFVAGVLLTTIPHLLTFLFGRYALKLNPALLFGAMTGAGTCTAAMNSVKEDSASSIPVIGYTVPYAVGNILLTVWGALIVHLV